MRMTNARKLGQYAMTAAKQFYQAMAPTSVIAKWPAFVARWWKRTQRGQGVEDKKRKGRTPRVTRDDAYIMATQHTQTLVGRGEDKRHYRSMEEVRCPACLSPARPSQPRPPGLPAASHAAC